MDAATKFASKTLFKVPESQTADLSWFTFGIDSSKFSWFLSALRTNAKREFYRILVQQETLGPWIQKQGEGARFFLYPFYVSKINTVLKSGFLLWKKGNEEQFFSLCDGAFNLSEGFALGDYPSLMTPGFKKMLGSAREELIKALMGADALKKPGPWIALPPSVSPSDVTAIYSAAHNFLEEADLAAAEGYTVQIPPSYKKMGFDPGKVKSLSAEVIDLVYLPLALTKSGPKLMGKHFGLDENLAHRAELCMAYDEFLDYLSSKIE